MLDDAASALDYQTDASLRRNLREHYDGATTIVIAQRISSVMNSDLILVLDEGEIIGAIGVSGGSESEDTALAAYGKEIFEKG